MRAWIRSGTCAAALALALATVAGCEKAPPPDPVTLLIEDLGISDADAIRQIAGRLRTRRMIGRGDDSVSVSEDAAGRPSLSVVYNPDISDSSSQIVPTTGKWTGADQRGLDLVSMNMALYEMVDVARVGVARNLQEIEIVIEKTLATEEGDQKVKVLRATLSGPQIAAVAATEKSISGGKLQEHWTLDFDHYDSLTFSD